MTWNYRVEFKRNHYDVNGDKWTEDSYYIVEAYYDENGVIDGITEDAIPAYGASLEELSKTLDRMKEALSKPVIGMEELENDK